MQQIFLGPAGSPKTSTLEGIPYVKEVGLQAMEVQFVRGVHMSVDLAKKIHDVNKNFNIKLSIHSPYYINLASEEKKKIQESKQRILDSCERAHYLNASPVVFHPAYFGNLEKENVFKIVKEEIKDVIKTVKKNKWNTEIASETTGRHSAFGNLDETISLVKETKCGICIDLAHIYARNQGKIDYVEVLDKVKSLKLKHLHFHFSGINYSDKGELNHLTLSQGGPNFEPFAKEILKRKINCTIISESPITWKDSLNMKKTFEKLGYKFI